VTVGTPDANGRGPNSIGSVRYRVRPGDPATPADEADVAVAFRLTDVRVAATLEDYTGELQPRPSVRVTDRFSGAVANEPGTVEDLALPATAPCGATAETNIGATCSLTTTLDALVPGIVQEGGRAIWELSRIEVLDGGPDGDADTSDNEVLARQGIFVP